MPLYDIKKVQISSILKILPLIFLIIGGVVGLFVFFLFPTDLVISLNFVARMLSWVVFMVLYTAVMVIGSIITACAYNFITSKMNNSIVVSLEPRE